MKTFTLTFFLVTSTLGLFSQEFEVPQDIKLDKAEDYAAYEKDILACIDWIMDTPINEQKSKRKEANAFLLIWLTGSPDVSIEINENIVTFVGSSPDLLMIYMGAWARYSIESRDYDDKAGASLAGIEAVIEFYLANIEHMGKDKNVEKYVKMQEKGTLEEYVEKNA